MGGSSLAPEVLRATLGVAPGYPRFQVLDSTDPAAVRAGRHAAECTTCYLVSSKSGTTIEPNSLAAHFRERLVSEASDTSDTLRLGEPFRRDHRRRDRTGGAAHRAVPRCVHQSE